MLCSSILFLTLLTFFPLTAISSDTLYATQSLSINQTLISPNQMFQLGFFNLTNSNKTYLGIWYRDIPDRTVVWIANRDNPVIVSPGILKISGDGKNILILDSGQNIIWSTNQTNPIGNPVLQILDTGNFVLKDSDSGEYKWQSFDYPTDTLLPDMKLGKDLKTGLDRQLVSWKNNEDPSTGDFSFKFEYNGVPELFLWEKQVQKYRSGMWNGIRFSGVPEMESTSDITFKFLSNEDEVTYSFSIREKLLKSRLVMNASGTLARMTYIEERKSWNQYWSAPKDQCDDYLQCGAYGICDTNLSPVCKCVNGFQPKNEEAWNMRYGSDGCVRKTKLDCSSDGFLHLVEMKVPESSNSVVYLKMGIEECRELCLRNCNCSAYGKYDVTNGGSGCVIWSGELLDMREYAEDGQELFVRIAASDLEKDDSHKPKLVIMIVSIIVGIGAVVSGICIYFVWKRKSLQTIREGRTEQISGTHERSQDFLLRVIPSKKYHSDDVVIPSKKDHSGERNMDELELPLFDFGYIANATQNFSDENMIGHGGFGNVYKGRLVEGQEVAVKRLSKTSMQGMEEFKNEVRLIARLQHRNLVRLLGCCVEIDEKVLIYEYMENRSLDSIIFNKAKSSLLDWPRRFNIICGTARGLLYLHQDSRFRIIHRDLKASNILLDGEMNPKISDFGMARIFGGDQTEANTMRVVGTYGYMAPEYAMDGLFSVKSDVFSFGVLVLEIISGKKNRGFYYSNNELNLLGHAWKLWKEGRSLELVDVELSYSYSTYEVMRCIQIGLLCVQERAEDRPTMSNVVLMLSSETARISQPTNPGFCLKNPKESDSSSSKQEETCTVNQLTVTVLDAR